AELAVVRLQLVPREAGRVTVRFGLQAWPPPRRLPLARLEKSDPAWTLAAVWYPGYLVPTTTDSVSILARAEGGTTELAVAEQLTLSARLPKLEPLATETSIHARADGA